MWFSMATSSAATLGRRLLATAQAAPAAAGAEADAGTREPTTPNMTGRPRSAQASPPSPAQTEPPLSARDQREAVANILDLTQKSKEGDPAQDAARHRDLWVSSAFSKEAMAGIAACFEGACGCTEERAG